MLEAASLWWQKFKLRRKMERVFGRRADPYDYLGSSYEQARFKAMEEAAGRGHGEILEIGCAEGAFTQRLAALGRRITAVDVSTTALTRARQRLAGREIDFIQGDIRGWAPPKGNTYGLIVVADVLYYLEKPGAKGAFDEIFDRIRAWLGADGRLVLAHAFASPEERRNRQGFRERFERRGLKLVLEKTLNSDGDPSRHGVSCLISVLSA